MKRPVIELKKALDYYPRFWEARRLMGETCLRQATPGMPLMPIMTS
jgi:hypothetical protein